MCLFITVIIPAKTDLMAMRSVLDSFDMSFSPWHEVEVNPSIPEGFVQLRATKSFCDCGTVLRQLYPAPHERSLGKQLAKHRAQGWSEAKLQRWLDQKSKGDDRRSREDKADLERWDGFLQSIVSAERIPRLGLLIHFYGNRRAERKALTWQRFRIGNVDREFLKSLQEDVVYEITTT